MVRAFYPPPSPSLQGKGVSCCARKVRLALRVCLAVLILTGGPLCFADGLADLVPSNVGICIQGRELPSKLRTFFRGPIGKRILAHHTVVSWRGERDSDLKQFKAELESHFQLPFGELCDGIAGRELLLGVWPEAAPGDEEGPAILLVHARDADTLRRAIEAIYDEQAKSGRVEPSVEVTIDGATHALRVIAPEAGKQRLYLAVDDDLGVLSNAQDLAVEALRRNAARHRSSGSATASDSLADLGAYQAALERLPGESAVTLFVNARAWDATLAASIDQETDDDELSAEDREKLLASWRATQYLAGGLALGDDIRAEGVWQVDAKKLPPAARELADAISGRAGFLEFVPRDALMAVSGRAQWGRMARLVWSELALGERGENDNPNAAAAADVLMQLLEKLGPDCGVFLSAAPDKGPEKLPLELAIGLETRSRLPRELATTATDTVDQSLRSALAMVTVFYNQEHANAKADLRMERVDGVPMTTLTGISELGDVQPTYTMTANGVLVGTSRDAVAEAVTIKAKQSLARSPRITGVLANAWSSPSQVFYLDAKGLRDLVRSHAGFAHHFAKKSGKSLDEAQHGMNELAQLLGLADTLVAACRVEPDGLAVLVHVGTE